MKAQVQLNRENVHCKPGADSAVVPAKERAARAKGTVVDRLSGRGLVVPVKLCRGQLRYPIRACGERSLYAASRVEQIKCVVSAIAATN